MMYVAVLELLVHANIVRVQNLGIVERLKNRLLQRIWEKRIFVWCLISSYE